jgi:hypothetical protein
MPKSQTNTEPSRWQYVAADTLCIAVLYLNFTLGGSVQSRLCNNIGQALISRNERWKLSLGQTSRLLRLPKQCAKVWALGQGGASPCRKVCHLEHSSNQHHHWRIARSQQG